MFNIFTKNKGKPDEERSYGDIFFLSVVLLTFATGWMFKDEFVDRRPWKKYQIESDKIEYKKFQKKYIWEKEKIVELRSNLEKKIEKARTDLEGNREYREALTRLKETDDLLDEIKQKHKFAKSMMDEAYYWYKHALHEGGGHINEKKNTLDEIQKEVEGYEPEIKKIVMGKKNIENKIKQMLKKEKELKKEFQQATSAVNLYKANMDGIKKSLLFFDFYRVPEIKQVVVTGLDVNNFNQPILRVDRCKSCHTTIDKEGFENEPQPFQTHPERELFLGKHPTAKFGCTVCHMGQGPAISSVESAHGEFHHENEITPGLYEPLFSKKMITASCRKCHDGEFNIKGAGLLSRGKQLFIKLGCHGCHKVKGYEDLRKAGPVLTRVGSKTDPSWMSRWVKRPKAYLPKTRMPFFELSNEDAVAMTAYLINNSDKRYTPDEKYREGVGSVKDGKKLFETVGCLGCHVINGKGSDYAPDLSRIANKVNSDWLISWMKNPKQYNEKTIMPSFRLTDYEAESITAYLLTLGKKEVIPGLEEKIKQKEVIEQGERLIRKMGCFGCHEIYGMEKANRIAPELTTFGNKRLMGLEFGDSIVKHTWDDWTRNKLKNPSIYRTERVLDQMPDLDLSDDETDALVVLLKSFRGSNVPDKFRRILTGNEEDINKGRLLVWEFNCYGCHIIEEKGGFISRFYKNPNDAPPILESGGLHEGEKVQGSWLFAFLKNPESIRPWLKVRMPTYYFTDAEVTTITRYFAALAKSESIYDYIEQREINEENIEAAKKLMSPDYFDCFECHSFGSMITPSGLPSKWAQDLATVKKRLRPDWIVKWLRGPEKLQPRTRMPNFFDFEDDIPEEILGGDAEKQIKALRDLLIYYEGPFSSG